MRKTKGTKKIRTQKLVCYQNQALRKYVAKECCSYSVKMKLVTPQFHRESVANKTLLKKFKGERQKLFVQIDHSQNYKGTKKNYRSYEISWKEKR